jgi:hypothetical protein
VRLLHVIVHPTRTKRDRERFLYVINSICCPMGGQPTLNHPALCMLCLQEPPSGVALLQPAAAGVTAPLLLRKATAAATPPRAGHP